MTITDVAHEKVAAVVRPGEAVVDATLGRGYDTVFLAKLVGETGRVTGFDVQAEAVDATRERLEAEGLAGRVELVLAGHERMGDFVPGPVGAVMFNLGYLPGADREVVTRAETTLVALEVAKGLLREGGILSVLCYPDHPGGGEETAAVVAWAEGFGGEVLRRERGPFLVVVGGDGPHLRSGL